jgi:Mn-dependent DtxR family transcriptional regulator
MAKLRDEDVTSKRLLRALYDLRGHEVPVGAGALARELRCSEERALGLLRDLKRQRLVRDYRRKAGRVWGIW